METQGLLGNQGGVPSRRQEGPEGTCGLQTSAHLTAVGSVLGSATLETPLLECTHAVALKIVYASVPSSPLRPRSHVPDHLTDTPNRLGQR